MLPKYSEIVDLMKKGANLEAQEKIMELRKYALELKEENNQLKVKLNEKEELLKKIDEYELVKLQLGTILYKSKNKPEHYICPKCFSNKEVHILQPRGDIALECPNCKNQFEIKEFESYNEESSSLW